MPSSPASGSTSPRIAARRRTIPIRVENSPTEAPSSPQEARRASKAYTPTANAPTPYRDVDYEAVVTRYMGKIKNPKSAIRARCIQCCSGQVKEVQLCPCTTCALHGFRMGENPFNIRTRAKNAGMTLAEYKAKHGLSDDDDDETGVDE